MTSDWNDTTTWNTRPSSTFVKSLPAAIGGSWYEIDLTDSVGQWSAGAPNYGIELTPTLTIIGSLTAPFTPTNFVVSAASSTTQAPTKLLSAPTVLPARSPMRFAFTQKLAGHG